MNRHLVATCVALVAGLWTFPARAGDTPGILVIPFANLRGSATRDKGDRVAEMLRTELKASDSVTVVGGDDTASNPVARKLPPAKAQSASLSKNERALAEAKNTLLDARDLSKRLKFKQAAESYQSAIQGFEANVAYVDFNDFVSAYLAMAVDQFRAGNERDGERTLATVVRLDPDRTLDETYPPVFQRIFEAIKKRLLAQPKGGLRVESTPPGATVAVDGREVGPAPVLVKDLVPGAHYVKLVSGGAPVYAAKVDVRSADVAHVTAQVKGGGAGEGEPEAVPLPSGPSGAVIASMANNTIDEAVLNKATDAAAKAGADYVVLGGIYRKENTLLVGSHLFNVKRQKLCQLMRISFDTEMLGAQLEVYKLANDVAGKVSGCDSEAVPAKVLKDAVGGAEGVAVADTGASTRTSTETSRRPAGRRPVVTASETAASEESAKAEPKPEPRPEGEKKSEKKIVVARVEPKKPDVEEDVPRKQKSAEPEPEESSGGVRRFEARENADELQVGREEVVPADERSHTAGVGKVALVTVIALVVAGALAGGTILIVTQANQPASGTATIHW